MPDPNPRTTPTTTNNPTGTGTAPAPTPSAALTTTVTGSITIGTGTNKASFPVSTSLPPPAGQKSWVFYLESTPDQATKINVGDFIDWAASAMKLGFDKSILPASLTSLTIALEKLNFDTTGDNYDIEVEIGQNNTATPPVWTPSWQPISDLPLTLDNVKLEFAKGTIPPNPNAPSSGPKT